MLGPKKDSTIIVRCTKQFKEDLKLVAKEDGRSMSNFIYKILTDKINQHQNGNRN